LATLLYLSSSPNGERSHSGALASAFLAAYRESHPEDVIKTIDLWDEKAVPTYSRAAAASKMAVIFGEPLSDEEKRLWGQTKKIAEEFAAADKYLFNVPLWNLGLPYVLKHYIDIITQPRITFAFEPGVGFPPFLKGKKAAAMYASGAYYDGAPEAYGTEFASPHLRAWLRLIGVTELAEVKLWGRMGSTTPDADKAIAIAQAQEAARTF
jgi:FMN-dependent NADH-azoreductase